MAEIAVCFKADDMGAAQGINAGTIAAHRRGVVSSTDVIVPGPWFLDAARLLAEAPELDVGVHLTLTSEWEGLKWGPLTAARSLVAPDGCFHPMVRRTPGFPPEAALLEHAIDLEEVERELAAQIERAQRSIPRVSFLSAHMGAATSTPALREVTERLSRRYRLPLQSTARATWLRQVYRGEDPGAVKAEKLARALAELAPGSYIHLDHAALDTPEMRAIGHEGYRNVAQDRSANVAAWCSDAVKEVLRRRGIRRTTIAALLTA